MSSPAETATAVAEAPKSSDVLASLSDSERATWLKTGDLPDRSADAKPDTSESPEPAADSAAALPPDPDAADASDVSDQPPVEGDAPRKSKLKPEQVGNPRYDYKARLGQVTEQRDTEKALRIAAEKRAAELEAKLSGSPTEPAKAAAAPIPTDEPKLADFLDKDDPYEALAKATAKWEVAQLKREIAQDAERGHLMSRLEDIRTEGRKKYSDWDERMTAPEVAALPKWSESTARLLRESEFSVDLFYHLSKNLAEVRALAAMDQITAAKYVGSLETRLSGSSASRPAAKPTSDAPPPPTTLGKKPAAPGDALEEAIAAGDTGRYIEEANAREFAAMKAGRR